MNKIQQIFIIKNKATHKFKINKILNKYSNIYPIHFHSKRLIFKTYNCRNNYKVEQSNILGKFCQRNIFKKNEIK